MENQQELKVEYIDLEKIIPYDKNPRNNSPAVEACAASIRDYGFGQPISVDENMVIISGHTRRLAALKIGMEKIPCIVRRDLTPEQVRAYRVVDNKIAELSEWNEELLAAEISDLTEFNFADYGFDLAELAKVAETEGKTDANAVPEVSDDDPPKSKRGEVYQCGEHRLMCGDSTSAEDVARLMGGEKADMVFTDPPYGVSYTDKNEFLNSLGEGHRLTKRIENDHNTPNEMHDFWLRIFDIFGEFTKDQMAYYITAPQGGELLLLLLQAIQESSSLALKHMLIWNKNNHVLGRCDYNYKHEPIIYGWKKKGTHKFYGGGRFKTSVWDIPKPLKSDLHPTMKPVELVLNCILDCSDGGGLVIDLFGGSGTTMIAAEKTGRKARLMELDPHYCDVIRKRWAEFVHGEGCDWEALTPMVEPAPAGTEAKA